MDTTTATLCQRCVVCVCGCFESFFLLYFLHSILQWLTVFTFYFDNFNNALFDFDESVQYSVSHTLLLFLFLFLWLASASWNTIDTETRKNNFFLLVFFCYTFLSTKKMSVSENVRVKWIQYQWLCCGCCCCCRRLSWWGHKFTKHFIVYCSIPYIPNAYSLFKRMARWWTWDAMPSTQLFGLLYFEIQDNLDRKNSRSLRDRKLNKNSK